MSENILADLYMKLNIEKKNLSTRLNPSTPKVQIFKLFNDYEFFKEKSLIKWLDSLNKFKPSYKIRLTN